MKAIIPAGGFGTRMLPVTKTISKELLPVGTKPVLQYIIEGLEYAGIKETGIVITEEKTDIKEYFEKDSNLENFLQEKGKTETLEKVQETCKSQNLKFLTQEEPLGLAPAILPAEKRLSEEEYFLLVVGDTIFEYKIFKEMIDLYQKYNKPVILLQEVPREKVSSYGVVKIEGEKITDFVEKPSREKAPSNLCMSGMYILPYETIEYIRETPINQEKGEIMLPDTLKMMMQEYDFIPFITDRGVRDTGNLQSRIQANNEIGEES